MKNTGKTLVFGASLKSERYSNMAVHKLRNHNHVVVAFGMVAGDVAGVHIDTELRSYKDIDTITLYMNPKRQKEYYDYLIGLQPRRILFNPGTENPELYTKLNAHGIKYEEACTLVLLSINQY
jgi:predicted CoA-binding protein